MLIKNTAPEGISPIGMCRTHDPETSKAAASKVCVPQREADVVDALMTLGGMGSNEQVADVLAHVYQRDEISSNVSPRMCPLIRKGLVEKTDLKHESRQGKQCTIFKLTSEGQHRAHPWTIENWSEVGR